MRGRLLFLWSVLFILCAGARFLGWVGWFWPVTSGLLFLIAVYDVIQIRHTILRNFPVVGHIRFGLEMVRPEIQQYFVESDITPDPIARIFRNMVYQRAKSELQTVPFGSELDFYAHDYQWLNHSSFPNHLDNGDFRIQVGNEQCRQPYSASLFNISAMSYGAISTAAIRALGQGAKLGGFYLNTGEGGLSPFHIESGCDLVWQLGTAYFGARDDDGYFSPDLFREKSRLPQIKMIEIKISQGAKPAHGGILPGVKVDEEIASIRRVPVGKTVVSPPGHTAFTNPLQLCRFISNLRELSEGKPIGFKFCLGRRDEFIQICAAMKKTGVYPDFITVDGGEGGTGAAPFEFINFVGSPLKEALFFVHSTLKDHGLRQHVRLIASGKVMSGFDIFEKLALGADICNSARGMMLALGCIQAYRCNSNKCPTGITTNDPSLVSGLDVADKTQRVSRYHHKTLAALQDLIGAAGLHSPQEVELQHISCRFEGKVLTLAELFAQTAELSPHEQAGMARTPQGEPKKPKPPVDA